MINYGMERGQHFQTRTACIRKKGPNINHKIQFVFATSTRNDPQRGDNTAPNNLCTQYMNKYEYTYWVLRSTTRSVYLCNLSYVHNIPWLVRLQVRAIQCNTWVGCGTIKKTCQEVCCAHCFPMQHISNIWYGHVSTFGTALHPVFYQKILRHPPAETNQGFKQTKIWGWVKHGETMFGCPKDQQFIFFPFFDP